MTINVMLDIEHAMVGFLTHYRNDDDHADLLEDGYDTYDGMMTQLHHLEDEARNDGYSSLPMLVEANLDIEYDPDHRMPRAFYAKRLLGCNAMIAYLHELRGWALTMLGEFDQPFNLKEDWVKRAHANDIPYYGGDVKDEAAHARRYGAE